ncbi:MAG TPA: Uma2 family endonuclease [Blastocatellia bacterium]|nr:Uma2 family endonuclease [Blastocatellia bacterium]
MNRQIQPVLTIADLDCTPDDGNKYELIEGEIYMSRAPSLTHQITLQNFLMALGSFLTNNPIGIVVPGPGVIFDDFNGVIPDIVFFTNERRAEIASGDQLNGASDLVIEIISPGAENERRDRVLKRRVYGRFGVKEYWLVDMVNRSVEVFRLGEKGLEWASYSPATMRWPRRCCPAFV